MLTGIPHPVEDHPQATSTSLLPAGSIDEIGGNGVYNTLNVDVVTSAAGAAVAGEIDFVSDQLQAGAGQRPGTGNLYFTGRIVEGAENGAGGGAGEFNIIATAVVANGTAIDGKAGEGLSIFRDRRREVGVAGAADLKAAAIGGARGSVPGAVAENDGDAGGAVDDGSAADFEVALVYVIGAGVHGQGIIITVKVDVAINAWINGVIRIRIVIVVAIAARRVAIGIAVIEIRSHRFGRRRRLIGVGDRRLICVPGGIARSRIRRSVDAAGTVNAIDRQTTVNIDRVIVRRVRRSVAAAHCYCCTATDLKGVIIIIRPQRQNAGCRQSAHCLGNGGLRYVD